jgi:hypothetical protein
VFPHEYDPDIYRVLWPAPQFAVTPACANVSAPLFPDLRYQRTVFDGEAPDPDRDYPRAAALCRACPVLRACREYADLGAPLVFLAGETAVERDRRRGRTGRIAIRRRNVAVLADRDHSAPVIAAVLGVDATTVRADLLRLRSGAA